MLKMTYIRLFSTVTHLSRISITHFCDRVNTDSPFFATNLYAYYTKLRLYFSRIMNPSGSALMVRDALMT